jgi:hypothetical protein
VSNGTGRVLTLVAGLISCAYPFAVPGQAASFTVHRTADATETPLLVQWCEQDLQDWRQRRDVVDYQIAEIDARLKDPNLREAERKALEEQKLKLMQDRKNIDWWIDWIFERVIHGICDAHNTGNDLQDGRGA